MIFEYSPFFIPSLIFFHFSFAFPILMPNFAAIPIGISGFYLLEGHT